MVNGKLPVSTLDNNVQPPGWQLKKHAIVDALFLKYDSVCVRASTSYK